MPEYSREYLPALHRPYAEADILEIAKEQLRREEKSFKKTGKYLFCDTEMLVYKIWSEEKFGRCHPWIIQMLEQHHYDLYLLCNTDIPWEADPLRENPHDRERLFGIYHRELSQRNLPFAIISGKGETRTKNAISFVDGLSGV